jgi:hypothetical protein
MKLTKISFLLILLATSQLSYAQNALKIGMSANEFKKIIPGVLPDQTVINKDLSLKERIYSIKGSWSFNINNNLLASASYYAEPVIRNKASFDSLINSAKQLIDDYTRLYGKPFSYNEGANQFRDRNDYEYLRNNGKRELFEEAVWHTATMNISISCDFRSNYYSEFQEGIPNGPAEWYYYSFRIGFYPFLENKTESPETTGRFSLGMNVNDFAKVFPQLFPNGIDLTGQWGRKEKIYGLDGGWAYDFESGKLNWMLYDNYIQEINAKNFDKSFSATKHLIADYAGIYGKPDSTIIGDTVFKDPAKQHHWSYDVIEAYWKNANDMKIKIEFTFMGGKGEYAFLVKITFFDKKYPYFD